MNHVQIFGLTDEEKRDILIEARFIELVYLVDNELNTFKHDDCSCDLCRWWDENNEWIWENMP